MALPAKFMSLISGIGQGVTQGFGFGVGYGSGIRFGYEDLYPAAKGAISALFNLPAFGTYARAGYRVATNTVPMQNFPGSAGTLPLAYGSGPAPKLPMGKPSGGRKPAGKRSYIKRTHRR